MDYQLLVLIGMIVAVAILATRHNRHAWPGRPGWQYQRVFSVGFIGLLYLVAGVIGWDLKYSRGWFEGTKLVDGPIWWQVGLGASLVALTVFWARRVPPSPSPR